MFCKPFIPSYKDQDRWRFFNFQVWASHENPLIKSNPELLYSSIVQILRFVLYNTKTMMYMRAVRLQNVLHWSLVAAVFSCYISHVDRRFVSLWWDGVRGGGGKSAARPQGGVYLL